MKWYRKALELAVGAPGISERRLSRAIAAAFAALVLPSPPSAPRSPAAASRDHRGLRQFPGFFHLQNILVRGEFKEEGGRFFLDSADGNIRSILENGVHPSSGPVEVRGQLIDVGRLEPGDPRVPDAEARDATRWPWPGEELVMRVTAVNEAEQSASTTIRALALEPWRYDGQR